VGEGGEAEVAGDQDPLDLARLEPWLEEPLPLDGRVRGELTLDGSFDALTLGGRLTVEEPGYRPTTAEMAGTLRFERGFGATGFEAVVEPLDWRLARIVAPGLILEGGGRFEVELDGRLREGISVTAEILHQAPGLALSDVDVQGSVRSDDEGVRLDDRTASDVHDDRRRRKRLEIAIAVEDECTGCVLLTHPGEFARQLSAVEH
jgi:hypothetical protein